MLIDDEIDCLFFILYILLLTIREKKGMHLAIAYYGMPCEFIVLKLRINLCYILEMSRKSSTRAITSLTNSSLDNVGGRDVNLGVSHEEEPNTHNTN